MDQIKPCLNPPNPVTLDNMTNVLWPSGSSNADRRVYAVLDGARDPQIYPLTQTNHLASKCLYLEPLTDKLRGAAPHIVELSPQGYFTQQLLQKSWRKSWGIFIVVCPLVGMERVNQHCRKLNIVEGPNNESMLFRYYDPRVMRTYLPTCSAEELAAVFGPIKELVMEGEAEKQLLCFQYHNEQDIYLTRHPV